MSGEGPQAAIPSTREQILARLRERILAFAASRMTRDVAEDLAQETLMLLHDKYASVDQLDELVPLALRIVKFKMTAYRRKSVRRGEPFQVPVDGTPLAGSGPSPETRVVEQEQIDRMMRAIARLGDRCRELLRLKLLGRSFPEIQQAMGAASINTVYTWDLRCRKSLLELMGGEETS